MIPFPFPDSGFRVLVLPYHQTLESFGVLCSANYPCHVEGQIQLLVQRTLTDKSAKLGKISVSPHSFIMPAQISHYFYNAAPSPPPLPLLPLAFVKCCVSPMGHLSSKEGGEFVIYEFLNFCYFKEGKLKYNNHY